MVAKHFNHHNGQSIEQLIKKFVISLERIDGISCAIIFQILLTYPIPN